MAAGQRKPEVQWSADERKAANSDQRLKNFQDSLDDDEDTRSSQEYLNDIEEEYHVRALLAKSKRFFKKGSQRFSSAKAIKDTQCHKCGRNGVERPWLSEVEGFIMPNHDTSGIFPAESQRNSSDPPVAVIDSSETEYDSADVSSVCSTSFPPLEKPSDVELVSEPKTVKTTLK
uniref:Retrovirus-related Pol polyprotein from transposon TNT 1-94 n=1 Tax=Tanacetum cinerariifolium TaxID=118510 RepID=A0A6L2N9B0_TANCI|nr:retrovirus-related Pol polyprotein from transposon TNT 1-94 [Tanacetum cinerariifolium]